MKKLLLLGTAVLFLTACAGNGEGNEGNQPTDQKEQNVEVDKGLLNVDITLPAELFEGKTQEEIEAAAKEDGVKDVTFNEDGSVNYTMSKADHEKIIEEMEASLMSSIDELMNSEDYVSLKEITNNDNFTEYDVVVNAEAFESSYDAFGLMGIAIGSVYYNIFDGKSGEDLNITINLIDETTGDVIDTLVYPEDMEEGLQNTEVDAAS